MKIGLFFLKFLSKFYNRTNFFTVYFKGNKYIINIYDRRTLKYEIRDIFFSIIAKYLKDSNFSQSLKIHLFNILYLSNSYFYKKALLINFISEINLKFPIKFHAPFISNYDQFFVKQSNVMLKKQNSISFKIINFLKPIFFIINRTYKNMILNLTFKTNLERFNKNINYISILESPVYQIEKIFSKYLNKSLSNTIIFFNPIKYNSMFFRQIEYLKKLYRYKKNFFLINPRMFLSKQIKFLVKIYLGSIEAYYFLPLMKLKSERLSIRRKIKLIKLNFPEIKNYYNGQKPEYQTFLVEELKNYKIKTISFSHGLAVNSPYLNYDVCYFFSRMQKRFFIGNFKTNYFKFDLSLRTNKEFYKRDLALVFIHQNIMTGNKTKLKKNYKTILQFIIKASNDYTLKVPVFIKFHPASTEKDKIPLGNISEIKRIEDLPRKYKFIAVTYFSTYVIELLDKMPFLIINPNDNLNLKFHFPWKDDLFVNNYIEFKRKIMELKDQKNYKDLWKNEMKYY